MAEDAAAAAVSEATPQPQPETSFSFSAAAPQPAPAEAEVEAAREGRLEKLDAGAAGAGAGAGAAVPGPEPQPEPEPEPEPEVQQPKEKKEAWAKSQDASIVDGDKYFATMAIEEWAKEQTRKKGYTQPTTIQGLVMDCIFQEGISSYHVLGQAPTGSGKTLCFVMALLRPVYDDLGKGATVDQIAGSGTLAVCVMPTMELAIQLRDYLEAFEGHFVVADGKTPPPPGRITIRMCIKVDGRKIKQEPKVTENIVIGTPGTILSFGKSRLLDCKKVTSFVLDEADDLLNKKMDVQTKDIQKIIDRARGKGNYNMLFFSATFSDEVINMCKRMAPGIMIVKPHDYTESKVRGAVKQVKCAVASAAEKVQRLIDVFPKLATGGGQTLVFMESRKGSDSVAQQLTAALTESGYSVESITGGKTAEQRQTLMSQFSSGAIKFMIATDVLCRGVNIPAVNFVINFDLPFHYEEVPNGRGRQTQRVELDTYLHRAGRCARFTNKGVCLTFFEPKDVHAIEQIERQYCDHLPGGVMEEATGDTGLGDLDDLLGD
jgi:ATP-dependent RNA helicase DDX19/DBP5